MRIEGRIIARGKAEGKALVTKDRISFYGDVDPKTGIIKDETHELFGKCVKDTILVFPEGKGSTVGSYVLYELVKNGVGPKGIINKKTEPIVAVGAILAGIPLMDSLEKDPVKILKTGDLVSINADEGYVEV
jgi:hypothetical protein